MIENDEQYRKALEELRHMEDWLRRLQEKQDDSAKGLTRAGIRKMIARPQDEFGAYEGQQEVSAAAAAR